MGYSCLCRFDYSVICCSFIYFLYLFIHSFIHLFFSLPTFKTGPALTQRWPNPMLNRRCPATDISHTTTRFPPDNRPPDYRIGNGPKTRSPSVHVPNGNRTVYIIISRGNIPNPSQSPLTAVFPRHHKRRQYAPPFNSAAFTFCIFLIAIFIISIILHCYFFQTTLTISKCYALFSSPPSPPTLISNINVAWSYIWRGGMSISYCY